MKALLFALLLVAFMGKDPVTSLKCYMCFGSYCEWKTRCVKGEKLCYFATTQNSKEIQKKKGCAQTCPKQHFGRAHCCTTDYCN
ncbi:three-fingered toxin-14 [Crotalus adamanteus]|uniref:Three-fingered toxin-14 n=1 Tax=Crotalus adamanteus TaxID=8729 RepID=A0AAW1BN42_CROAD